MTSWQRSVSLLFIISLVLLPLSACSGSGAAAPDAKAADGAGRGGRGRGGGGRGDAVEVRTATTLRISIQRMVDLSGSLISPDQVRVSNEVGGTVASMNMELGQEVQAGQVLLQLDTRELQLAVERAESALRQTEAQLGIEIANSGAVPPDEQIASVRTALANREEARVKLSQAQELVNRGLLPKSDLDTTETRLKVAEAAVQASLENVRSLKASLQDRRANYELSKKKLADATVRAPAGGTISERLVQKGEFIRENTQIATIVQLSPLKLQTAVQEKFADLIRRNLPVQFRVEPFPDELFEGRVSNISPSINQQTRTFTVEILVSNPRGRLKPGFFAKGAILTHRDENVLAVPQQALSTLAGVSSVYVIEDGMVRQQNIQLGVQEGDGYEVISGLKGDELLAASRLNEITTGMAVRTESSAPNAADPPAGSATGAAPGESSPTRGAGGRRGGGARRGDGGN